MADYRCANPEYQLDVDVMIVEYTLYCAIDTSLKALESELLKDTDRSLDENDATNRLVENFDVVIRLFRHNHPTKALSEGTTFSIKILEFLVLLGQWIHPEPACEMLNGERSFNTFYRRQWLESWAANLQGPGRDMKGYINNNIPPKDHPRYVELTDILMRFMELSAEIADALGPVNEQWYRLAAEFMLHCATERLNHLVNSNELHSTDGLAKQESAMHLSECFAWGVQNPNPTNSSFQQQLMTDKGFEQRLQDQVFIRNMFGIRKSSKDSSKLDDNDDVQMTNTAEENVTEDPVWTRLRTNAHLSIFQIIETCNHSGSRKCDCPQIFQELGHSRPLEKCLLGVCKFVEDAWCLNMNNFSEKPILVQIEEGSIKGLSDGEFKQFLDNVGLKMSSRGEAKKGMVRWLR